MPLAYCQKLIFKGYAKRTPYVKNLMPCYMTTSADFTCQKVIYYRWKSSRNTTTPIARHPSYEKTLDLLQHNYYWPGVTTTIKEYITRCDTCQRFKGSNVTPAGLLHSLETPSLLHISADFITDLPLSHGFDAILMVIDWFSKEVELIPCTKTCLALDMAKLFMHNVWMHHGLPHSIISDQGPQFATQVMQEINKALSISTKLSTYFYPQMDSQTEIINKEVQKFLQIYCFEKQDQWANWLAIAQFSINSKKHTSTKIAPFEATWSYIPHMGLYIWNGGNTGKFEKKFGKGNRVDEAQCW